MNSEPSNIDTQNQDEKLQAQLDAAGSELDRIIIFLDFVHKEEPLSQQMLEKDSYFA